jgi:5'-3' exonuclease
MKKILFSICILLFAACDDTSDEILEEALEEVLLNEPLADIETILDKGITIDGITLDYATIYQSIDNFPVIKPNPINQFINESEILVYFELISRSREALLQYYAKIEEENLERGIMIDYKIFRLR